MICLFDGEEVYDEEYEIEGCQVHWNSLRRVLCKDYTGEDDTRWGIGDSMFCIV
ncbi:hypothetical protein Glove_428g96 [Diversispora epigaea]|uniref:Uncharacterized protein n=1 Tax=Diversispora epigaea TaxID=1348612 RepID=A0A397GVM1_9GLOM|nr:hypothetical protein Glove_428g96 [Diversispora epigaea]